MKPVLAPGEHFSQVLNPCPNGSFVAPPGSYEHDVIRRPLAYQGRWSGEILFSGCYSGCPLCAQVPIIVDGRTLEQLTKAWETARRDLHGNPRWITTLARLDERAQRQEALLK
jgi:hypothetical protein